VRPDQGTCQATIGLYLGGAVGVEASLAGAEGCPLPATVKRFCARHGNTRPTDGVWLCLPCAELGHDCPLRPEVVADV
jgi:hypothetical protein